MANIIKTGKNTTVHGIKLAGKTSKFSAYYEDGVLVDAEQILTGCAGNIPRSIKKDGPIWQLLERRGKIYCGDEHTLP